VHQKVNFRLLSRPQDLVVSLEFVYSSYRRNMSISARFHLQLKRKEYHYNIADFSIIYENVIYRRNLKLARCVGFETSWYFFALETLLDMMKKLSFAAYSKGYRLTFQPPVGHAIPLRSPHRVRKVLI
jgi:hypothetical protein